MDKRLSLFVAVTCGIAFFLGIELGGFSLVLLQVTKFFDLNNIMMGTLVTSQFSAVTAGPLIFGWAADRFGKKTVLLISVPLVFLGYFGAAFSGTVSFLIGALVVAGIGFSVSESICSSALSDSFPGRESKYLNLMQCAFCLGAVLSPQLFSRLFAAGIASWRAVFLLTGGGFTVLFPLLCISRCKPPLPAKSCPEQALVGAKRIFSPRLFLLLACMMSYVAIETGVGFFADALYVTEYSNSSLGAHAISLFWLAMTLSRFGFAHIKTKMRDIVILGFSATIALFLLLMLVKNQWFLLVIFALLGVTTGPIWPMVFGIGASSFREKSGTVGSILYAGGGFGGTIIPVVIGWVSGWAGFYGGFWALVAAAALGLTAIWLVKKF